MATNQEVPEIIQQNISAEVKLSRVGEFLWRVGEKLAPSSRLALIVSGPSGVGKDSVVDLLDPTKFARVRTATTRTRRPGENEDAYYWLSQVEFDRMVEGGEFVEHIRYANSCYGTVRARVEEIMSSGRIPIFRVEPRGARRLRQLKSDGERLFNNVGLVYFFIVVDSEAELIKRLQGRDGEQDQQINERVVVAKEDLSFMSDADYIVLNERGRVEEVAREVEEEILKLAS